LKVTWASDVLENACLIGAYIRSRQTLLSHYRAKVVEFNKSKQDTVIYALQFCKPSMTRFAFHFDVPERCGRNKSVCQAMIKEEKSFDRVSTARTADARQINVKFCNLLHSSAFWKNSKALCDVMEPLILFLRKWDSPTSRIIDVCLAVVVVEEALRDIAATKKPGLYSSASRLPHF
jgi:hypothetical protein